MTKPTAKPGPVAALVQDVLLEIVVEAPRERVWKALVEQTSAWWHKDFYTGSDAVGFHLQPKLGGWMYEDWGDGHGLIWGTVIGLRAPAMLQVAGDSGPEWGGPSRGIQSWQLTPVEGRADATTVRFRHSIFGNVSDATRESLASGWRLLFEQCLKPYAESGVRPPAAGAPACSV